MAQLLRDGRNRLNALPGVEVAAAGFWLPIDVEDGTGFQMVGRPADPLEKDCCSSAWMSITPDYLRLFKIPLLRGRDFTENDNADAPAVDLINEAFARKFFPQRRPRRAAHHARSHELRTRPRAGLRPSSGMVADFHDGGLAKPADPMIIAPIPQVSDGYNAAYANIQPLFWLVRTHGDPHALIPAISEQLRIVSDGFAVAPYPHHGRGDGAVHGAAELQYAAAHHLRRGGAAARRHRHLRPDGLFRRATHSGDGHSHGAGRRPITHTQARCLARHEARLRRRSVGMAASFGLTRLLSNFLFGVKPWDLAVFVSAPIILTAIALLAVWLPAAQASKLEPMQALRAE